jgi:hypothetical protein
MRPPKMERLGSRAVATSGNRWQMGRWRKGRNQAQTVAIGCDRLPPGPHGKEGVDLRPVPTAARVFGLIARSLPT